MILSPIGRRRRIDRLAQLLDGAEEASPRHTHPEDDELARLLAVARVGRRHLSAMAGQVTVDPGYRDRLRQRLLTVGQVPPGDASPSPEQPDHVASPSRRKIAVLVGVTVAVLVLGGAPTASREAVPGDALYPVKRQTEQARLAMAGSDLARGRLHLGFARTRLDEAQAVVADGRAVTAALGDMDAETRHGVKLLYTVAVDRRDPRPIAVAGRFLAEQRRSVARLLADLPDGSRERASASLGLLDRAAVRADRLRENLSCARRSDADSLGPLPADCADAPEGRRDAAASHAPGPSGTPPAAVPPGPRGTPPGAPAVPRPSSAPGRGERPGTPPATPGGVLDELGRLIGDLVGQGMS